MELPIEAKRFKFVREELGFTQAAFGAKLNLTGSVADLERGRTKIAGYVVTNLLEIFQINPLWLFGKSKQKYLKGSDREVTPMVVSVDNTGVENIMMINQKASAGYAHNIHDPEYIDTLPVFTFPLPEYRNATFRCFQIQGDSMEPAVHSGDWIIAQALENLNEVKNGEVYIIVDDSSIRFKKVRNDIQTGMLTLVSINPDYPVEGLPFDQIRELWRFHSKLSFELVTDPIHHKLDRIQQDLEVVKQQLITHKPSLQDAV